MFATTAATHPRSLSTIVLALALPAFAGCGRATDLQTLPAAQAEEPRTATGRPTAPTRTSRRTFDETTTLVVTGRPYVDTLELPGVTLRGVETTDVMAKIGGYVETIGQVDGRDIDIGTYVTPETMLAVLQVPELEAERHQKAAAVAAAEAAVEQVRARVEQVGRQMIVREAEIRQAEAARAEKEALIALRRAELRRLERLAEDGAIEPELLDEARYALAAAEAAARAVEADVHAAQARHAAARADLEAARADLAAAQADLQVAEAERKRLEELLAYRNIRPPFPGVVTARNVDRGAFVQPAQQNSAAQPLFTITRTDLLRAIVYAPAAVAPKLEVGQAAVLDQITGLPGVRIATTVARVNAALEARSRMLRIECDVRVPAVDLDTGVQVKRLMPGQFARLTVKIRSWEQLPIVPTTALLTDDAGRSFVVLAGEEGPRRQRVQVVFNDGVEAGIAEGLQVGQRILRNPARDY
ncbi:MAG: efflux RND transporter periplasmic adaptor subunit [Planctomycetota bacterium]|nr:MAG: efflux RND transporter periplasmic adaptor subunit [Planctomycetota bacterium]